MDDVMRFFLIFFCSHPVESQYPGFFWKHDYLVKPKEGFGRQIAVREGEVVMVQCYVRSDADDYTIDWAFEDFHANSSSTFRDGNEYSVSNLIVHIDNPDDIDEKEVTCLKTTNGDTIDLQFKVFVNDSVNCGKEINLSRWKNRTTEDGELQNALLQSLTKRLKEKLNCANDEVTIGICGCKKKVENVVSVRAPFTPPSIQTFAENDPTNQIMYMYNNTDTEENNSALIALITLSTLFGILVVIFTISYNVSQKARDYTQNYLGVETVIARLQSACSNYCDCKKYRPPEQDKEISFETENIF